MMTESMISSDTTTITTTKMTPTTALEQYTRPYQPSNRLSSFIYTRSLTAPTQSACDITTIDKIRHELIQLRQQQLEIIREHDKQITELIALHQEREAVMLAQFSGEIQATPSINEAEVGKQVSKDMEVIQENHKAKQRAIVRLTNAKVMEAKVARERARARFRLALMAAGKGR